MNRYVRWKARELRYQRSIALKRDVLLEEVARATGLSMNTLSLIENNRVDRVEFNTMERLAEFYGVESVADLLEFSEEPRPGKRAPGLAGLVNSTC